MKKVKLLWAKFCADQVRLSIINDVGRREDALARAGRANARLQASTKNLLRLNAQVTALAKEIERDAAAREALLSAARRPL